MKRITENSTFIADEGRFYRCLIVSTKGRLLRSNKATIFIITHNNMPGIGTTFFLLLLIVGGGTTLIYIITDFFVINRPPLTATKRYFINPTGKFILALASLVLFLIIVFVVALAIIILLPYFMQVH